MKRSRVSSTSDDPLPDSKKPSTGLQQQMQGHSYPPPLDVTNFPANWPKWRQKFQIYLSATHDHNQLTDRKKLAIFLNCVGDDGIAAATSFFPQIIDFDCAEARNITLDMVWSRFNDHCASMKDVKLQENIFLSSHEFFKSLVKNDTGIVDCYKKLFSAAENRDFTCRVCQTSYTERIVRDQLVRVISDEDKVVELLDLWNPSCQEIIAAHEEIREDQTVWWKILPYLCLCDIDTVAQMSPRLKRIVDKHVDRGSHGLQIEPCCLQKHPIDTDKEFYDKYKCRNQLLKLSSICKTDVDHVLECFPKITGLALHDIQIYEALRDFPPKLEILTITNSVIERHLLQGWLNLNWKTLQFLKIENVDHSFPLHGKLAGRLWEPIILEGFDSLRWLIIRCDTLSVKVCYNWLSDHCFELLHIRARELVNCNLYHNSVEKFILEVPTSLDSKHHEDLTVTNLILLDWSSPVDLTAFDSIKNLTILSPVDVKYKDQIENLPIKSILVTYEQSPEEEPELIFQMLNDDCFLEIISYLKRSDWIYFGLVHPRSFWIVLNYKYRSANFLDFELKNASITPEHMQVIYPFVRRMIIQSLDIEFLGKFNELTSLEIQRCDISKDVLDQLPDNLEKLVILNYSENNGILSVYFERLRPTLRVLRMAVNDEGEYLLQFRDLREINLTLPNTSKIGVDPSCNIATFLEQNPGLQRVDLFLGDLCPEVVWNAIGALKNLSDLTIHSSRGYNNWDYVRDMPNLLRKIGPQLKTLRVEIWDNSSSCLIDSFHHLHNLKELEVFEEIGARDLIKGICRLKSLRTLRIDKISWTGKSLTASNVVLLVKELPNLRHIHATLLEPFSIKMGLEFQQYLRENNRELLLRRDLCRLQPLR